MVNKVEWKMHVVDGDSRNLGDIAALYSVTVIKSNGLSVPAVCVRGVCVCVCVCDYLTSYNRKKIFLRPINYLSIMQVIGFQNLAPL